MSMAYQNKEIPKPLIKKFRQQLYPTDYKIVPMK